jgi:sulfoxide reductase heme-binding subunit YedZ
MKRSTLILLKVLTWVACLWPLALLIYGALTPNGLGADPSARIALSTGYTTLVLIAVTLAVTPVRRLSPRLNWLIRFRRLLGLFAFFYATIHMLTYVALYSGFNVTTMLEDVSKRPFITFGAGAWLLMLPLALTSTTWAIRKLGGKRWNLLHKLIYVIAFLGLAHFWWQVKPGVLTPVPLTIVIWGLLLVRPVLWLLQRSKARS